MVRGGHCCDGDVPLLPHIVSGDDKSQEVYQKKKTQARDILLIVCMCDIGWEWEIWWRVRALKGNWKNLYVGTREKNRHKQDCYKTIPRSETTFWKQTPEVTLNWGVMDGCKPLGERELDCVLNEAVAARTDDEGSSCLDAVLHHHVCCYATCMEPNLKGRREQMQNLLVWQMKSNRS